MRAETLSANFDTGERISVDRVYVAIHTLLLWLATLSPSCLHLRIENHFGLTLSSCRAEASNPTIYLGEPS